MVAVGFKVGLMVRGLRVGGIPNLATPGLEDAVTDGTDLVPQRRNLVFAVRKIGEGHLQGG